MPKHKREKLPWEVIRLTASPALLLGVVHAGEEQSARAVASSNSRSSRSISGRRLFERRSPMPEPLREAINEAVEQYLERRLETGGLIDVAAIAREMARSIVDMIMEQDDQHQVSLLAETISN
jgi:hypothetical protein